MIWNNRLQLDYGFLYSADKPILQKTKDRIYFESKWGYETPVKHLAYSANFDFKTQFNNNYKYGTPKNTEGQEPTVQDWLNRALYPGQSLAELQEDLADEQNDHAIEATEDALDKQEEAYHAEKDREIEVLQNSISSYQKLYDMA